MSRNAGVWTDEEVIRYQLIALEQRLSITRDLRKLIAEKVRRLTVSYAKSMEEDQKKGSLSILVLRGAFITRVLLVFCLTNFHLLVVGVEPA